MTDARTRCTSKTKTGKPCAAPPLPGRPFCFHHDPERAEERADAKRRGGLALHYGSGDGPDRLAVSLATARDVVALLETAAADLLGRKPSATRARGLGYLASIALKAVETVTLDERVAALEARLELRKVP